jgi:hypothetical protein
MQNSLPRLSDDSSKRYKFEFVEVSKHPDFLPLSKVPKMIETPLLSLIHQKYILDLTSQFNKCPFEEVSNHSNSKNFDLCKNSVILAVTGFRWLT